MNSNFEKLKTEFQKETGQLWNADLKVYIAYYQAKTLDALLGNLNILIKGKI